MIVLLYFLQILFPSPSLLLVQLFLSLPFPKAVGLMTMCRQRMGQKFD